VLVIGGCQEAVRGDLPLPLALQYELGGSELTVYIHLAHLRISRVTLYTTSLPVNGAHFVSTEYVAVDVAS
jgi:hypothetical protein